MRKMCTLRALWYVYKVDIFFCFCSSKASWLTRYTRSIGGHLKVYFSLAIFCFRLMWHRKPKGIDAWKPGIDWAAQPLNSHWAGTDIALKRFRYFCAHLNLIFSFLLVWVQTHHSHMWTCWFIIECEHYESNEIIFLFFSFMTFSAR